MQYCNPFRMKLFINNLLQVHSFRVTGGAGISFPCKYSLDDTGGSAAESDIEQRAGNQPLHVVQEVIGYKGNLHFFHIFVNLYFIELFDG